MLLFAFTICLSIILTTIGFWLMVTKKDFTISDSVFDNLIFGSAIADLKATISKPPIYSLSGPKKALVGVVLAASGVLLLYASLNYLPIPLLSMLPKF